MVKKRENRHINFFGDPYLFKNKFYMDENAKYWNDISKFDQTVNFTYELRNEEFLFFLHTLDYFNHFQRLSRDSPEIRRLGLFSYAWIEF